ncbi:MAG: ELM1/GtrOC1 family putative glycosyltransferase [Sulfurospirillaceae bacterium]|nr:ELM1/GtrOC1 family putative glycosyltransferase [Sulfurospirillaceae bacterium]
MNLLIISDGRAGHLNQSIAYAKHHKTTYEIIKVKFSNKFLKALSYIFDFLHCYTKIIFSAENPSSSTYDGVVSTGSNTYYANKTFAKIYKTKSISMMLPKGYRYDFDTIFAQSHDNPPTKENITILPINFSFVEPKGLFSPSKKSVGIIIGGNNSYFKMHKELLKDQLDFIFEHFKEYEIALTTSPRTPQEIEQIIENYNFDYSVIYSKNKANPIADFLHHCEVIFITMDSTSMISEALSYGNSYVEILPLNPSKRNKFYVMVSQLEEEDFLHIFDGKLGYKNKKITL